MGEPQRLLDDSATSPLVRSVLASAAGDAPSPDHRARAAKRLGIAASLLAGGEAGTAVAGALVAKLGVVLAVLGGITAIALLAREPDPTPAIGAHVAVVEPTRAIDTPVVEPSVPVEPAPERPVVEPAIEPPVAKPPFVEPKPRKAPKREVVVEPPPVVEQPVVEPPVVEPDARRLAAEVALLDRARAALKRGDATAALALLDEHRRDFADGVLVAAAELVRLETLIQSGQHAAARSHGAAFLARFPQSPLARRVRSLVDRMDKETP